MSKRELAVSGSFYPNTQEEILKYINHFNLILEENKIDVDVTIKPLALIVPHAGYIYSGFTANMAYRYISTLKDIKNIIVIGPSHKFGFEGASVSLYDIYPTPLGDLTINKSLGEELLNKFSFLIFEDRVHCEHSTETQFPFIKHYANADVNVLEIVYSDANFKDISQLIEYLLMDKNNLVIFSTDLSHFYSLDEANKKDNICLEAIVKKDNKLMDSGCEACGKIGVKGLLDFVNNHNFGTKLLDYRTSADTSNDKSSVVGYTSALVYEKN